MMSINKEIVEYVLITIDNQCFGLPVSCTREVFMPSRVTRVPFSPREVIGVMSLRGYIPQVIIDMRFCLQFPAASDDVSGMVIATEHKEESYGLLVDKIENILLLPVESLEPAPYNPDEHWSKCTVGVYRLGRRMMTVLDVDCLLEMVCRKITVT